MAVTITRTPWIDDDGSGTVGTVINNAVKTSIYNEIDGALAKVAQLAGGNTFTGNQTMSGQLAINTGYQGRVSIGADMFANHLLVCQNLNAGVGGNFVLFLNGASGVAGSIAHTGDTAVTYGTASDARLKDDAGRAADLTALRAVVVHELTWKADGRGDRGVFAQEAHPIFPRAITEGTDETTARGQLARPWMTDYSKFVPDLIVGWQQHDAELVALRAQVATLKGSADAQ
jgi:hypothetical protein